MRVLILLFLFGSHLFGAIEVVMFDFGSVIARFNNDRYFAFVSASLGLPEESVRETVQSGWRQIAHGEVDEETFWHEYANCLGGVLPPGWLDTLYTFNVDNFDENDEVIDLVLELQGQGYLTPLLSNINAYQKRFIQGTGLYDLFYPLFLSSEIGMRKPEPEIYEYVLGVLGSPPETILFVDNKEENLEAARAFGMHTIHCKSPSQVVREVRDLLGR